MKLRSTLIYSRCSLVGLAATPRNFSYFSVPTKRRLLAHMRHPYTLNFGTPHPPCAACCAQLAAAEAEAALVESSVREEVAAEMRQLLTEMANNYAVRVLPQP